MITINIIPKELKKSIKLEEIYHSLNKFGVLFLVLFAIFVALYYAAFIYLEMHYADVSFQSANLNKNTENYSNQVLEINNKLKYIESIQIENIKWIDFLTDFSAKVNDGITVKALSSTKSSGHLIIRGQAKTRDALLDFEKSLKGLTYLSEINIPLKNLLEKENINFDIQVKIDLYEFAVK